MFKGLREYIALLEAQGELMRISEYANPAFEIAEITRRASQMPDGGKALLFENTGTPFPVLTNAMGSEKRMLHILGAAHFDEIKTRIENQILAMSGEKTGMAEILKQVPQLLRMTRWNPKEYKGIPPCQEIVMYKPQLNRLPVLTNLLHENTPCITLPLIHTLQSGQEAGRVESGRMRIFSDNTAGIFWNNRHSAGMRALEAFSDHRLPVAICLGGDPVYTYAAAAPLPRSIDPYRFAGFLRNQGVRLSPCLTQELQVPADCDFVIEGYIDKNEAGVPAGTGFPMHITCISHRKDAVYPATVSGIPPQEETYRILATEKIFLPVLQHGTDPDIQDIYSPEEGMGQNFVVVKIKKQYPGQAIKTAHALWGSGPYMLYKIIIVVDDAGDNGPDIRNRKQLAAVLRKNYHPKRDTHFSRGPLERSDTAAPQRGFGGKMCLDATVKFPEEGAASAIQYSHFIQFIHPGDPIPSNTQIAVMLDKQSGPENKYQDLWLAGTNVDPIRDARFEGQTLVLDATAKQRQTPLL